MQATKPVKKPRKQRKHLYNAPAHLRHKFMAAPLSQELISSKGAKALPVKKGDTVRIMRGDHTGFEGKVSRIDLKRYRIFVEGLTREKVDGTNIFVSVHPSKVMIKNLKLDDKWRQGIVERKKELELPKKEKEAVKVAEKPPKKVVEVKKEKPVKKPKAAARAEKKPTVKPKAAQKKPVAKKKKEEAPAAEEKAAVKKKKKAPTVAKEKPVEKEKKPKAVKKAPAKRKTAASKKKGGT
jgi:large subunit ribosomal protein L24